MPVMFILLGLLAAIAAGAVALFTAGEAAAIGVFAVVLGITVLGGWFLAAAMRRMALVLLLVILIGSVAYTGWSAAALASGLTSTEGAAEPVDPAQLQSANAKLDAVRDAAGFRLELTETELTAVVQEGLQSAETPIRRVALDFFAGTTGDAGHVQFRTDFKNGSLNASGSLSYRLEAGGIRPAIQDITISAIKVPVAVRAALEDLIGQVADLDSVLKENRVTVQSLAITDDRLIIIGTQGDGKVVPPDAILSGIRSRAASLGAAQAALPERLGPGQVNATTAPGSPVYVAIGDSLAANVGVGQPREGYLSRFHAQLQQKDGKQYGLRNFGIAGETSGTLLRGQLDEALAFIRSSDVAYITVDIGANDILPHLASPDCAASAASAAAPACASRIDASTAAYRGHLDTALGRIRAAAPKADIVFLQTYNPFSFGFQGLAFEDDTNKIIAQVNQVAAEIAQRHGMRVADGATPLKGRAGSMTHMADAAPDIHPQANGYDALAAALLEAK